MPLKGREFVLEATVVGLIAGVLSAAPRLLFPPDTPVPLESRIESLSTSLQTAATVISEIEAEISARQALVDQLRRNAETARQVAILNKEQSEAIAQALKLQLDKKDDESFWESFFVI